MLAWFKSWLDFWEAQGRPTRTVDELIETAVRLHKSRPVDGPLPEMVMTRAEINLLADHFSAIIAPVNLTRPPEFMGLPVRLV